MSNFVNCGFYLFFLTGSDFFCFTLLHNTENEPQLNIKNIKKIEIVEPGELDRSESSLAPDL